MSSPKDAFPFASAKALNVIVVGGSLAGLMHGVMFKRLGHNVRILEQNRSSTRANHAAGIGTGPRGIEYLEMHDLSKQPYAFPCPGFQYLNKDASVKRLLAIPQNLTTWDALYFRLRANFDGLKSTYNHDPPSRLETDGEAFYEVGKRVVGVSYSDNLVTIEYVDLIRGGSGSLHADIVIVANGSNSTIRNQLLPQLKNTYSGYVAWRGLVPEKDVSESTRKLLDKRFNVFVMKRGYILGYAVPGENGVLAKGDRFFNFVWYYNCPENSREFIEYMTDTDGYFHVNTLPIGKMRPDTWEKLKAHAREVLNPPFLELVNKTARPFISTVRDCAAPRAMFYNNRLVLVGEALSLYRPHTGISVNQCALDCLQLRRVLQGEMTAQQWEEGVLWTQKTTRLMAIVYGEFFQSGLLSLRFLFGILRFVLAMILSRLVMLRRFLSS